MAKAKRESIADPPVSPQLTFHFRQLREHGESPARAIEWLTHALKLKDAVPKPALPDGWRLEADGDELFVVSPEGRRNAREFSLYEGRYLIAPPGLLKPPPQPPDFAETFYPDDALRPTQRKRKTADEAPSRPPSTGFARFRADHSDPPPTDPALVAALDKLAEALKPRALPPKRPKAKTQRAKRRPRQVAEAIIAAWCDEKRYRQGVPKEVTTQAVWRMMKTPTRWNAMCAKLGFDPKEVQPPETWHTVGVWLERR